MTRRGNTCQLASIQIICLGLVVRSLTAGWSIAGDDRETRDGLLIILTPSRPILVSVNVHVDGVRLRKHFARRAASILQDIDANHDGLVTRAELNASVRDETRPLLSSFAFLAVGSPRSEPQLSLDELTDWLAETANGASQIRHEGDPFIPLTPAVASRTGSVGLFEIIDRNGDGTVNRDELLEHQDLFRDFDVDGDDAIGLAELQFDREPFLLLNQLLNRNEPTGSFTPSTSVIWIPARSSLHRVASTLLARYGTLASQTTLAPRQSVSSPAEEPTASSSNRRALNLEPPFWDNIEVRSIDFDADGRLDFFETQALLTSGYANLQAEIHCGRESHSSVKLMALHEPDRQSIRLRRVSESRMLIQTEDMTVELAAPEGQIAGVRDVAQRLFAMTDSDNNGYVEPAELSRQSNAVSDFFELADTDKDEQLYSREWTAFFDQQAAWADARMGIEVIERQGDFASLVDSDRDLRITHRELLVAADQLSHWTRDGSGQVTREALPPVTLVMFGPDFTKWPGSIGIPYPSKQMTAKSTGRSWFERLDHNRDGDVSKLEFIGPDALFTRIDTNADGLIELNEAMRYNEQFKDTPQKDLNKD